MALPTAQQLAVELVPHCTSVTRDGWTGSHDIRPLAELGMRQAAALVAAIGTDVDGIYSSPAARCRQTVGPLAAAAGLPVHDLAELYEAGDFGEPAAGTQRVPDLMVWALGGAWAAGAQKFKTRYAMLGFSDKANLDEGAMWPVYFALTELTAAAEAKIGALVKQAVS